MCVRVTQVDLTEHGEKLFANFLFRVARVAPTYTLSCRMEVCCGPQRAPRSLCEGA
jgi:hypothetical protein